MATEAIKEVWSMAGWGYNFWHKKKTESEDNPTAYFMLVGALPFIHLKPEDVDRMKITKARKATLQKMVKWTRPSYYILTHLRKKYLNTLSAAASRKRNSQRPQVISGDSQEVVLNEQRYLMVDGLADRLGRSSQTIRNMAKRGEIPYIWARMGKRRAVRLFPLNDEKWIEALRLGLLKDKDLAKTVGLSTRQIRNIKHRLAHGQELSRLELKRKLVAHLRTLRSS